MGNKRVTKNVVKKHKQQKTSNKKMHPKSGATPYFIVFLFCCCFLFAKYIRKTWNFAYALLGVPRPASN